MTRVTMKVDGSTRTVDVDPRMRLLDALRGPFRALAPKLGCGTGDCGACTVVVDGDLTKSCLVLAVARDGSTVRTLEGLSPDGTPTVLQSAFTQENGFQCGFCLSGILLTAQALLDRDPNPDERTIRDTLGGNICRCSGYQSIVDAVLTAAASSRDDL